MELRRRRVQLDGAVVTLYPQPNALAMLIRAQDSGGMLPIKGNATINGENYVAIAQTERRFTARADDDHPVLDSQILFHTIGQRREIDPAHGRCIRRSGNDVD